MTGWILRGALVAGATALLSWGFIRFLVLTARRRGHLAVVRADRWHAAPTPIVGGIGIALSVVVGLALARGVLDEFRDATSAAAGCVIALLAGSVGAAAMGFWDDLAHFVPSTKLAAQCVCAGVFLWMTGGIELSGSAPIDGALSLIWIVSVMNAVNMLDNMDGVAGTAVTVGLLGIATVNAVSGNLAIAMIALVCAGAVVGFLGHNMPRARVFMGDAGSLFLGFMLAALVLLGPRSTIPVTGFGCALVPLLDMTIVSFCRIRRGASPMRGGRDHMTHRLVARGLSEGGVVWLVGVVAASGAVAASLAAMWSSIAETCLVALAAGFVCAGALLLRMCIQVDGPSDVRSAAFSPFVKVLLDVVTVSALLHVGYLIRWDFEIPPELTNSVAWSLPVALGCCIGVNALRGEYVRSWRWTGAGTRRAVESSFVGAVCATTVIVAVWSPDRLFSRAATGIFLVGYPLATVAVRTAVGWIVR